MNAHHDTNSGAFGSAGLHLARNHRTGEFSTLNDVWTYTSNDRNETTGFSEKNSSGTVIASGTYVYDSLDRRIGVDETSGGTTTQTWIVYNGNSNTPYAEFNGSGTLLERYLAGPSYVPGVTGMVARTNASGVTDWYLTGKLGSVRDIVNTSGTVIDHISYGAFGSIRAETNPSSGSQFKFDGMQRDQITGINYDYHRYYSANTGRFITQDPTGFSSGDNNFYSFTSNGPDNHIDPEGLWEWNWSGAIGGGVTGGVTGIGIGATIGGPWGGAIGGGIGGLGGFIYGGLYTGGVVEGAVSGVMFGVAGGLIGGGVAVGFALPGYGTGYLGGWVAAWRAKEAALALKIAQEMARRKQELQQMNDCFNQGFGGLKRPPLGGGSGFPYTPPTPQIPAVPQPIPPSLPISPPPPSGPTWGGGPPPRPWWPQGWKWWG